MKTNFLTQSVIIFTCIGFFNLNAQVGINTVTPEATLDIQSKGNNSSTKAMIVSNSDDKEMVTVTNGGRVGIGATVPDGALHVKTLSHSGIINERFSTTYTAPSYLTFRKNNSSDVSVNGAVRENEPLGTIIFTGNTGNGYEGNVLNTNTMITGNASEDFTSTAQGSDIRFFTVPNGTNLQVKRMTIGNDGKVGIGRVAVTNTLEVGGEASKSTAGSWIGNSDERLKKNIQQISGDEALDKLLKLKGVSYYWADNKTGIDRPKTKQMGFTAQNIQTVFPEKVQLDANGYLQTAYGDYDAILVEAMRALHDKNKSLERKIAELELMINKIN